MTAESISNLVTVGDAQSIIPHSPEKQQQKSVKNQKKRLWKAGVASKGLLQILSIS